MTKHLTRSLRTRLLGRILRAIRAVGRRISLKTAQKFGTILGAIAWHIALRDRRKAIRHIAMAFPELTDTERRQRARQMFDHLGQSLMEVMWLPNLTRDNLAQTTTVEGMEAVEQLVAEDKGVIAFTGHCGNWEWLAWVVALHVPVTTMHRGRDEEELNELVTELRAAGNIKSIDRGSSSAAREMLQAIRKGGLLAFLIDQNIRTESVKVTFFGLPAPTPIAPARFAIRAGASVVLFLDQRLPDGRHHVRVLPPIETSRNDEPVALTTRITALIEEQIRRAPEQWVWMHDRWKERPKWDVTSS